MNFKLDNKFFEVVNKIVDSIYASLIWMVFSLPIFTLGASTTALYYTVHKSIKGNRGYVWRSFWSSFKSNFKQTTIMWVIMMVVFSFLFTDYQIMSAYLKQGSPLGMLSYFFFMLMLFWGIWCVYIFTYTARFENGIKAIMKNTAIIAVINLPWSILVLVLLAASLLVMYLVPFVITFLPAGLICIYDIILEKIYRKYMSEEDLKREIELDMENH
mgnify:CR=1 FL=1